MKTVIYKYTGKTNYFFTKESNYPVSTNDEGEFITKDNSGSDSHELSDDYLNKNFVKIFTQAMKDDGILPSVGMEYLCGDNQINKCIAVYGDVSIGLMIEHVPVNDYLPLSQTTRGNCLPLTPPIELIDGKAYEFDYIKPSGGMQGALMRYRKNGDYFYFDNTIFKREYCTNIQLLEVK